MSRTPTSVLRSLARYMALVLPDYEVGLVPDMERYSRPCVHVYRADEATYPASSQWIADVVQPFVVDVYPTLGRDVSGVLSEEESLLIATEVEDILYRAFKVGVDAGRPMRVPLYDYTGVPIDDGSLVHFRSDFARVTDLSIGSRPDPNERAYFTVTASVRLSWRRTGREIPAGAPVVAVNQSTSTP